MSEFGGGEILGPGEGATGAPEQLSEEAKQRFAAAAAQMQQIRREEKKAKKRDDRVAGAIKQFLSDDRYTHMSVLISRLVARDCPSVFILAIISLIDETSREAIDEYIKDQNVVVPAEVDESVSLIKGGHLPPEVNSSLLHWISRLQLIMALDAENILLRLLIDQHNIDGTVLQLTTFTLVEFFSASGRPVPFEQLQPLTTGLLQTVIEPHLHLVEKLFVETASGEDEEVE